MSRRAKVHLCCLLVIVACEAQCAALRYFADLIDNEERRHAR